MNLPASQQNRFDLIRLVLASGVFVYHAVVLAGVDPKGPLECAFAQFAEICIQGFFIVSGALVAGSYDRSSNWKDYAGKRLRRLYPAYAVVIVIPAFVSFALTGDTPGVLAYLAANLTFLNFFAPNLPGLFESNRLFPEVNGALWTLKIEVMFYMILPLIFLVLNRLGRLWWLAVIAFYIFAEAWTYVLPLAVEGKLGESLARQLPGQLAFFAMGIALWKCEPQLRRRWRALGLAGMVLVAASLMHPLLDPLRAFALSGLIAAIAFAPGPALNAARFGDISYGIYITHFPILQALLAAGLLSVLGAPAFFSVAAVLVIIASFMLWHLVEKPALRPSSHYRKVAAKDPP